MADKIAIMNKGKLQQVGSPHEIFNHPVDLFVATFMGSPPMNLLECTLTEKNESYFLDAGTFALPVSEDMSTLIKERATSSELILGVRPEDIILGKKKSPDRPIEAEVYVIEPLWSEVIIDLKVGDNLVKVKTVLDFAVNMDEKVWIGFNNEKIYLFDKKTERIII